jgi:hypothetical protein
MDVAALRADCARCASLCCVALAFDRSPLFAFDKANGVPCSNLDSCGRCRIHAERAQRGFAGCVAYDCFGAGQRVTQEVFGGRSWRDEPSLMAPMSRAFVAMRQVHELLVLLNEAGKLGLTPDERCELSALERVLRTDGKWSSESLAAFDFEATKTCVSGFLRSLRGHVAIAPPLGEPVRRSACEGGLRG